MFKNGKSVSIMPCYKNTGKKIFKGPNNTRVFYKANLLYIQLRYLIFDLKYIKTHHKQKRWTAHSLCIPQNIIIYMYRGGIYDIFDFNEMIGNLTLRTKFYCIWTSIIEPMWNGSSISIWNAYCFRKPYFEMLHCK